MHDPRKPHLLLLKQVLRYLSGTPDYGLHLTRSASTYIVAYSDADCTGCPKTNNQHLIIVSILAKTLCHAFFFEKGKFY